MIVTDTQILTIIKKILTCSLWDRARSRGAFAPKNAIEGIQNNYWMILYRIDYVFYKTRGSKVTSILTEDYATLEQKTDDNFYGPQISLSDHAWVGATLRLQV